MLLYAGVCCVLFCAVVGFGVLLVYVVVFCIAFVVARCLMFVGWWLLFGVVRKCSCVARCYSRVVLSVVGYGMLLWWLVVVCCSLCVVVCWRGVLLLELTCCCGAWCCLHFFWGGACRWLLLLLAVW